MAKMRLDPVTSQPTLPPISQEQLETEATNLGYQGAYTDTAAMIDFIKAQELAQKVVANQAAANVGVTTPSADTLANLGGTPQPAVTQQGNSFLERDVTNLGYQGDLRDTTTMESFITPASQLARLVADKAAADKAAEDKADRLAADKAAADNAAADKAVADKAAEQGNSFLETEATNLGYQGAYTDTAAMIDFIAAANQANANANANVTKPSTDTLANLGGTGTVVDGNKINTQGNTGTQGSLNPYNTMDATGATPEKVVTPPVTPPVTGLTLADLQKQGYLTNDQLQSSLSANQTALTKQNEKFLTDWGTQADTWKAGVLKDVDTKNQAFGTQATQGFMDAFKNYQLPTNTAGVNMGNYNDNRTTAGDQWWSQYVTGRR